ncbi:MAG: Stf0 family sulfotransferase [Microcystaceae cyanobacterium]
MFESKIKKSYIICSTGRSGSTLLCKTLSSLEHGNATEYFHLKNRVSELIDDDSKDNFTKYLTEIVEEGTTSDEIFGTKMHLKQMNVFLNLARKHLGMQGKSAREIIEMVFPNPYFIHIYRRDTLRQVISLEIAKQKKMYQSDSSSKVGDQDLVYKPLSLYKSLQVFKRSYNNWHKFFAKNKINYYEICYEDFAQEIPQTVLDVLTFLEITPLPDENQIVVPVQKLSNEVNDLWYKYYSNTPDFLLKVAYFIKRKMS